MLDNNGLMLLFTASVTEQLLNFTVLYESRCSKDGLRARYDVMQLN